VDCKSKSSWHSTKSIVGPRKGALVNLKEGWFVGQANYPFLGRTRHTSPDGASRLEASIFEKLFASIGLYPVKYEVYLRGVPFGADFCCRIVLSPEYIVQSFYELTPLFYELFLCPNT